MGRKSVTRSAKPLSGSKRAPKQQQAKSAESGLRSEGMRDNPLLIIDIYTDYFTGQRKKKITNGSI